ncbi:MAG: RNA polymerase sigma-70 factor [Bacteroidetes bacterium]|nr:RNA polymerase sigma-70 factor [Bacteroidota bacterium]
MQNSLHNEPDLLERIAAGDEAAFGELLEFYRNRVYSHALAYVKRSTEAEDMVQDIFVRVWVYRARLVDVKDFADYLFILSRNQLLSAMRRRVQEMGQEIPEDILREPDDPDVLLLKQDLAQQLHKAVAMLPPQQQAVFTLSRFEHLSQDEIAEKLGISKRTVKFHMGEALKFLRKYLRESGAMLLAVLWRL